MSRQSSHDPLLAVIREEHATPAGSFYEMPHHLDIDEEREKLICSCHHPGDKQIYMDEVDKLLAEKEEEFRLYFEDEYQREVSLMKDKFDFILHNEQVRTTHMLHEAHRERQEKISALRSQLECKNLAGLMYVVCNERKKSKLEKLKIIEEYTNYIQYLTQILNEGQDLILNLSRGYKTAARVDHEWREKMKKVMNEFQNFVYHFAGGTPEQTQYFFNLPNILQIEAAVEDDFEEDPIDCDDIPVEETKSSLDDEELPKENMPWYERLDGDCRPFLMFGDMADFKPPQRREVLKHVKAAKTAPKKWKEYLFNEMFLHSGCTNVDAIKNEYFNQLPAQPKWECHGIQTLDEDDAAPRQGRRATSVDIQGKMGSILKIMTTSSHLPTRSETKTTLLAAKDSMEIASTTKLRAKRKDGHSVPHNVVINIGEKKHALAFKELDDHKDSSLMLHKDSKKIYPNEDDDSNNDDDAVSHNLGSVHHDSLEVISSHVPERDHKIHSEKVCPADKCKLQQVDSFMRSLPPYMRANPFMHIEQTFEDYESCTPEQLEILKQRIEDKKKKAESRMEIKDGDPLKKWTPPVEGVGVQTSDSSISLPPCTCNGPFPTPASSKTGVFRVKDLLPVKLTLDEIREECFYDENIQFNRFKVVEQVGSQDTGHQEVQKNYVNHRLQTIKEILKKNPSLCEIFQANTRC